MALMRATLVAPAVRGRLVLATLLACSGCVVGKIGDKYGGPGGGAGSQGAGGATMMTPTGPHYSVVVQDPRASGSKVQSDDGLSCADTSNSIAGTTCANAAPNGKVVTLTATAAPGFEVNWGGACASSTSLTCTFTVATGSSASVSFDPKGAGIWWVSKSGKDGNAGNSIRAAFATLQKGLNAMAAGDTLYIDDGVYSGSIGASAGPYTTWSDGEGKNGVSATKRTTILGYRRHAVTIDGGGKLYPLFIFKAQHVEVGNIVALHAALEGENSQDRRAHRAVARHLSAPDRRRLPPIRSATTAWSIGSEVSSDVTIEECWTWGFGARYGILLHGGLHETSRDATSRATTAASTATRRRPSPCTPRISPSRRTT